MNDTQRYSAWTASGWLGIVFGGLFAAVSGAMLVLITVLAARGKDVAVHGTRSLPGSVRFLYADARILPAFFFVAAILAFSAGIGLVRRRTYGRTLTIAFAGVSIAWSIFVLSTFWFALASPSSQSTSLVFRLYPALVFTPLGIAFCIAVGLLCRSVYLHPEAFRGERPGIGA